VRIASLAEVPAIAGGYADRSPAFDGDDLGERAVDLLRQYLRIPTANDPAALGIEARETRPWEAGHEAEAAGWIAAQLRAEGIEVELLEAAPGRVNVVARLTGKQPGAAITLLSHSDVVPAPREGWSCDPFGGEISNGYLYGRGALDLKGLGIVHLLTLVTLKRLGVPLERDVVLLVVADEETGGRFGADWLLAQRPELLATGLVLGEGAYSVEDLLPNGRTAHAVAVGEKGYLELELLAAGDGGHAGIPPADSASHRLVRALDRILSINCPIRFTPLTRKLLSSLAPSSRGLHARLLRNPWLMSRLGPQLFAKNSLIKAMVQDTIVATVVQAGQKHNVVPTHARAVLSVRLLPDTDPEQLSERIGQVAADCGVDTRRLMHKSANLSSFDTWFYRAIESQLRRDDAHAVVTPILSPAASDCRFFRAHGIPSYGWIPFVIPAADLRRVHGVDERVSIAALQRGVRQFVHVVLAMATTPSGQQP